MNEFRREQFERLVGFGGRRGVRRRQSVLWTETNPLEELNNEQLHDHYRFTADHIYVLYDLLSDDLEFEIEREDVATVEKQVSGHNFTTFVCFEDAYCFAVLSQRMLLCRRTKCIFKYL